MAKEITSRTRFQGGGGQHQAQRYKHERGMILIKIGASDTSAGRGSSLELPPRAAFFNYCRGKPQAPIRQLLATAAAAVPRAASRGASVTLALARSLALAPLHEPAIAFTPVPTATSATSGAPAGAGSLRHINNAKQREVVKWYHQTRTAYSCDRLSTTASLRFGNTNRDHARQHPLRTGGGASSS